MSDPLSAADDQMLDTSVSRLYAFCGVFLILTGMLLGDIFAVFILHPNNGRIGEALYAAAAAIPTGDIEAIGGYFQAIGGYLENRGTKVDAHSHGVAMGYVAILLAILQPCVAFSAQAKLRLAKTYVVAAIALPVSIFTIHYAGLAYSPFAHIGWASVAADVAGLTIAFIVLAHFYGAWQYWKGGGGSLPAFLDSLGGSSRILLSGGALLMLAGFVYGGAYAAYLQYFMSPGEVDILKGIVANAAAGQSFDAEMGAYGGYLAFRGLNMAAHAHVNTMAILLLIAALVQPFVMLSDTWKKRWAVLMVAGSFALPIFILLELRLGLLAGGFADTAGLLAMVALGAMLVGLARRTGATDSGGTG